MARRAPETGEAVANAPSDECTGEQARAYDAWIEGGRNGERPADCESY
ncbi:MAG: hypothetical protein ACR2NH_04430 [Solirubrobacteraceae bacterium]